jgi:hypothetical protein
VTYGSHRAAFICYYFGLLQFEALQFLAFAAISLPLLAQVPTGHLAA